MSHVKSDRSAADVTVSALAADLVATAQDLAGRFDARNGTAHQSGRIAAWLAARPLTEPFELPPDEPPRAAVPAGLPADGRDDVVAPLTVEAMISVLTEPKNALVKQYEYLFSLENAKLTFTDAALEVIAQRAMARKTGARALRAVMEEVMMDLLYELPEVSHEGAEFVIDRDSILHPRKLSELRVARNKSA